MNPNIFYKDLSVDLAAHRVRRAGHELCLTPREFALLAVLVTHCDTALSRSQLLEAAWGYTYIGESRTVDVHINRLRRKLGLQNDIQTVYKIGYRLNSAS
ncbi:winged helix-turn-helix domain-containing protein [Gemmiger sp.]